MSAQEQLQRYLQLARQHEQQGQTVYRDRCLELAICIAWQAGKISEAERLWQRLRQLNPHLYLCGFASLQEAMQRTEIKEYLESVQKNADEWLDRPLVSGSSLASPGSSTTEELNLPLETSLMRDSGRVSTTPDRTASFTSASFSEEPRAHSPAGSSSEQGVDRPVVKEEARASATPGVWQLGEPPARQKVGAHATPQPPRTRLRVVNHREVILPERVSLWVAAGLAVLLAVLGLLLAAYILLAPFLPDSFLR